MNTTHISPNRSPAQYVGLMLRGFCMGAADVVPGVSGGTMAFILGIYEELISSIRAIDVTFVKLLLTFRIRPAFARVPWRFLLALGLGIGMAILSLARGLEWMFDHHPTLIWSFFFGLVLASMVAISRRVERWRTRTLCSAGLATLGAYMLVGLVPVETPNAPWFLLLSGALAICAMLLPGISGAFILVLLGKYRYVLDAVNNRDLFRLFFVAAGAGIGVIAFSRLLSWLFGHYRNMTLAALTGLMLGSLRKVWPWKETVSTLLDRHGKEIPVEQINVLPGEWTGEAALALGLMAAGLVLVLVLELWVGRRSGSDL